MLFIVVVLVLILAVLLVGSAAVKSCLGVGVSIVVGLVILSFAWDSLAENWLTVALVFVFGVAATALLFIRSVNAEVTRLSGHVSGQEDCQDSHRDARGDAIQEIIRERVRLRAAGQSNSERAKELDEELRRLGFK